MVDPPHCLLTLLRTEATNSDILENCFVGPERFELPVQLRSGFTVRAATSYRLRPRYTNRT